MKSGSISWGFFLLFAIFAVIVVPSLEARRHVAGAIGIAFSATFGVHGYRSMSMAHREHQ